MKITRIETMHVAVPFTTGGPQLGARPSLKDKPWVKMESLIARVETDDGLVGWGEGFGTLVIPAVQTLISTLIGPWFLGKDPRQISPLMQDAGRTFSSYGRTGPMVFALSAIDIALWDLAAKRAGQPLYRLLGGRQAPVECYGSLMRYGGDLEAVSRNTKRVYDKGFRTIKLHEVTVPAIKAARDAVPDDARITVDVNCAWAADEARDVVRALRDMNIYWLEEPIWPPENFEGMAALRREGVAIAAGENITTLYDFRRLFDVGAVDVAQPSVVKIGGVSAMLRVLALAQAYPVRIVPHGFYWGPGHLATAALLSTMSHPSPLETAFITMERSPQPLFTPEQPTLTLPETPGLGFEPDEQVFAQHLVSRTLTEMPKAG
jgi:L-rhamnonate dehydratase